MKDENRYMLALYTSPRRGGNTSLLLDALVEGAGQAGFETESYHTARMDIRPCRACNACMKDGECVQKDDMQEIYPHLTKAGAVALAAPIFSMNICAQAKALIDRCQRLWATMYALRIETVEPDLKAERRGFFLSCCGRDVPETFECTGPTLRYFFHIIQVGGWESLTFAGVDEKGEILEVEGAIERSRELGLSLSKVSRET